MLLIRVTNGILVLSMGRNHMTDSAEGESSEEEKMSSPGIREYSTHALGPSHINAIRIKVIDFKRIGSPRIDDYFNCRNNLTLVLLFNSKLTPSSSSSR